MAISKQLLKIAGRLSFAVAFFQAVISFVPSWSLYFGAPEELTSNIAVLIIAGLFMTIVFIIFGLYALSGAGQFRPMPFLRMGLLVIGAIFTLRGLLLIPQLLTVYGLIQYDESASPQMVVSSIVSLLIGLLYIAGTIRGWNNLPLKT